MAPIVLVFSSVTTADYLVAGIPAAARALREVSLAFGGRGRSDRCTIAIPGGWTPCAWCRSELTRLAPELELDIADLNAFGGAPGTIYVRGEALVPAKDIAAAAANPPVLAPGIGRSAAEVLAVGRGRSEARFIADLQKVGAAIVAATGKPGDGMVSRYFNRPISQAISRFLLRFPRVAPLHATLGTAGLAVAMAACLFFGGKAGLIAGAMLFQAASIFDGVDGEIARATFQTSTTGAMLDSLTDAATNFAFIAGVTVNLWLQGYAFSASAGAAGLVLLTVGLYLIGRHTGGGGGPFTFDAVKNYFRARRSRVMQWLIWLTMRDFYAAAGAILVLAGLAPQGLIAFAVVTGGWLVITVTVLFCTGSAERAQAAAKYTGGADPGPAKGACE